MPKSYQLEDFSTNRSNQPFFNNQTEQEGPVQDRECTDTLCLVLFLLFVGTFVGILAYVIIAGDPIKALAVHNAKGVACYQQPDYPYGYFTSAGSTSNAMCVSSCPLNGTTVSCLPDNQKCKTGTFLAPSNYSTFTVLDYCVPIAAFNGHSVTQYFDYNLIASWIFDINSGYLIIIGAAVSALILTLIYICLLRCMTGCILVVALSIIEIILIGIGILLILQASGIHISDTLTINMADLSNLQLYIVGGSLLALALIFLLLIICLCSKIQLGVKVVEMASTFLSQRFYMALQPILSAVFFFAMIAALLVGGIYLYGTGQSFFGAAGLWLIAWIFHSNSFVVISAASIWYYKQDSPFCTSFGRLLRYHTGSVAFLALIFTLLFIVRLVAKIFNLRNEASENKCANLCIKIMTACLLIFDAYAFLFIINRLLKFLSEGIFVQIAMYGTNYCSSTMQAFQLITSNPIKISITGTISYMVSILGVLFITAAVCTAAYFLQVELQYFSDMITSPIPLTVVSGIVVIVISGVFLSILTDSSEALIQCYLIDQTDSRAKGGSAKFAPQNLRDFMQDQIQS